MVREELYLSIYRRTISKVTETSSLVLESESNFKKGGDFSALLYCAEHHGITADRKTKITEVSTETAEKCTVGCEMQ